MKKQYKTPIIMTCFCPDEKIAALKEITIDGNFLGISALEGLGEDNW